MKMPWLFLIYLEIVIVIGFKYLITNPVWSFSHVKFNCQIADVLAAAGHNVTILTFHHIPLPNMENLVENPNVNVIHYYPDNFEELKKLPDITFPEMWNGRIFSNLALAYFVVPGMLREKWVNTYTKLLRDKKLFDSLRAENFDAVIAETFELGGFYISYLINARAVIAIMSSLRYPYTEQLFGQPNTLGYIPGDFSRMGKKANVWDRLNDIYTEFMFRHVHRRFSDIQYEMYNSIIGYELPHWKDLIKNASFFITNSNPYLDFAIPKTANIISVGGFTISKFQQLTLPEEYDKLLGEFTIIISFGSVVRAYEMPEEFRIGFIGLFEAFRNITFILKYEKDDLKFKKRLGPNVYLKSWMPQAALLRDKRVKLFITHGGLGSTMEVAYSGKPALMIPLFSDQGNNAMMLSRHGGAVAYDKYELANPTKLIATVRNILETPSFAENAQLLANVLHNQPTDPKKTLLNHIEFATKFPKLKTLVPENNFNSFMAFYYLDAYFLILVLVSMIVFCLTFIFNKLRCRKVKLE